MRRLILGLVVISSIQGVLANPLQIKEAQEHLQYLTQKKAESRREYEVSKKAYKAINDAFRAQKSVVYQLIKADKRKQEAERKALEAENIAKQYDSYLSDNYHSAGGARLR